MPKIKNTTFKIRDLRHKQKFMIDDKYLNGFARYCGPDATLVYIILCRHANFYTQTAFPSQQLIADRLGITMHRIRRGIKNLMEYNIIHVSQERSANGRFSKYIYTLIDKSRWIKPIPVAKKPQAVNNTQKLVTGGQKPLSGRPSGGKPLSGNSTTKVNKHINVNKLIKDNKPSTTTNKKTSLTPSFSDSVSVFNNKDGAPSSSKTLSSYKQRAEELTKWSEEQLGSKLVDRSQQLRAAVDILKAGYDIDQVKKCWNDMEKDTWWAERGFDLVNVKKHIHKFMSDKPGTKKDSYIYKS